MTASTSPTPATVSQRARAAQPERMNGADAIVRSLEELGIDLVFGLPGGAVLPLYEALYSERLK